MRIQCNACIQAIEIPERKIQILTPKGIKPVMWMMTLDNGWTLTEVVGKQFGALCPEHGVLKASATPGGLILPT